MAGPDGAMCWRLLELVSKLYTPRVNPPFRHDHVFTRTLLLRIFILNADLKAKSFRPSVDYVCSFIPFECMQFSFSAQTYLNIKSNQIKTDKQNGVHYLLLQTFFIFKFSKRCLITMLFDEWFVVIIFKLLQFNVY